MTTLRPFTFNDLFTFNCCNLDWFTETYNLSFYTQYLLEWPNYFWLAETPDKKMMGYILGKAEGEFQNYHGHISNVCVAPDYRRLGLGTLFMELLEQLFEEVSAFYVDLFVRKSNENAIKTYEKIGYIVYQTLTGYYNAPRAETAYDMRKALSRDYEKKSLELNKLDGSLEDILYG